jgi:hypothetical protein
MDDVDLRSYLRKRSCNDAIVERHGPQFAEHSVRDTPAPARQRRANVYIGVQGAMDNSCEEPHLAASAGDTFSLMPGGVADPAGTDLVREALEHPDTHDRLREAARTVTGTMVIP